MVPHPSRKFLGILQIQYCLEACALLGSKSRKKFYKLGKWMLYYILHTISHICQVRKPDFSVHL